MKVETKSKLRLQSFIGDSRACINVPKLAQDGLFSTFQEIGAELKLCFKIYESYPPTNSGMRTRLLSILRGHNIVPRRRPTFPLGRAQPRYRLRPSLVSAFKGRLSGLDLSKMTISLKPDFGPNDCFFPGLPKIRSLDIDLQVFTHRSFYARAAHVFEDLPGDLSPDNEKFEHLGDSVLQTCITTLLMEVFPGLRVGPATKIRSMIVANFTLAQISQKYRLPDRLRLHPAQAITLRASSNIRANVFEAFVGGLYVDQGLEPVQNWVYPLFRPYAIAAYRIAREQHGLPAMSPSFDPSTGQFSSNGTHQANGKLNGTNAQNGYHPEPSQLGNMSTIGHLALFNQHVQRSNKQVEWVYSDGSESDTAGDGNGYSDMPGLSPEVMVKGTKVTPVWYVKVIVDGQFFGKGRGNTKKAARNEAAKEGLSMLGIEV